VIRDGPIETVIGRNSPGLNQGDMKRGWNLIKPIRSHAIPDIDVAQRQDLELLQAQQNLPEWAKRSLCIRLND
jgi:hypothetical protein